MSQDRIAQLTKQLYQNHRHALHAILDHRRDYVDELSERLAELLRNESDSLRVRPMVCAKTCVRFLPDVWDTNENREGTAWGNELSAYVLCQLWIHEGSAPQLTMVEGGS